LVKKIKKTKSWKEIEKYWDNNNSMQRKRRKRKRREKRQVGAQRG